ncbi:PAS domain S-box protein [Flavobacterium sp.]|uniref:PAS domain S-box protein n=1 Tax=Flavobacterium sp. TaxID=239 RepID=UPI00286C3910|nr:PAS domain S-box protein [Flavobacterium sp.]
MKKNTANSSVIDEQNPLPSIDLQNQNSFDFLQEGVQIHDFDWKYIYVNDALVQISTYTKKELIGKTLMQKYPDIEQTDLFKVMQRCMTKRVSERIVTDFKSPNGLIGNYELSMVPIPEGLLILSIDRSEQKKVNEKLLKIKDLYAFISQVNQGIVRVREEKALYKNSCKIAVEFGKFKMAWIGLFDSDYKTITMIDQSGLPKEHLHIFKELIVYEGGPQDCVLKSESYFMSNDIQNEPNLFRWAPFAKQYGIHSIIVLPFKKAGKIIGTLNLYSEKLEFSDKEEIDLLIEVITDISFALDLFEKAKKHKETEELVLQNERRFRALIEKSPDMQSLTNESGEIIYGSPSVSKVLGYPLKEYLNIKVLDFIHPDDIATYIEKRNKITATPGKSFLFEMRLHHKNGDWIWCEGTITNMLHIPSVNAFVANFRDASEKKRVERQLKKSEAFSKNIINSLSSHIAVIDKKGAIIAVNEAWSRFATENGETTLQRTGISSNYFHVCANSAKTGDETAEIVLKGMKKVMDKQNTAFYYEYPCHSDKEDRWFAMLAMPFDGEEQLIVVSHQDISKRKLAEDKLISNNDELKKTNFELDRFVYSVSHDLRSPLTSVLGLLAFIEEDTEEPSTASHAAMIRNSINRLDEYIKNILYYSRNNRMELKIEKIDLQKITEEIINSLIHSKEAKRITFEVDIHEKEPFYTDKQSFSTVIENLISNAIKFQDTNKTSSFIKILGIANKSSLTLVVSDNGIGIAAENFDKIFDMFFRLSGEIAGSGIGLYIVKEIVEKIQGSIKVDSKFGKKTSFTMQFKNLRP